MKRFLNWRIATAAAVTISSLIVGFQNCSPTPHLTMIQSSTVVPESLATGHYCTSLTGDSTKIWKFLFIVDMSRSNIGDWTNQRWDFSKATDQAGTRFAAIQQFMGSCGASNPNNQFQVEIFSDQAGVPTGSSSFASSLSCTSPFGSATSAQSTLSIAQTIQTNEVSFWKNYTSKAWDQAGQDIFDSGSLFMMDTHYGTALKCASQLLQSDRAVNPTASSNYVVFFLTDGRPYDTTDACQTNSDEYGCYATESADLTASMAIDAATASQSLQMLPIYYGSGIAGDQQLALQVLNSMARATGGTGAVTIDTVNGSGSGSSPGFVQALCNLTQVARKIDYRKEVLSIVNLTTRMVGGTLMADSDMDGIPDDQETALGFDPTNRRTFGVFDGVCQALGGPQVCQQLLPKLSCADHLNNLGISDCDLTAYGITNSTGLPLRQFGIDTDKDGLPDLVELIRGTNPTLNDADADTDDDGMSNQAEINGGRDPLVADAIPVSTVNKMIYSESQMPVDPSCPNGSESWYFNIQQLPVMPTLAYTSSDTPQDPSSQASEANFDFSHAANENVILITYKLTPVNSAEAAPQTWGAILKVQLGVSQNGVYQPVYKNLQPTDFFFLGDLK